jgi:hypothetical protein
MTVLAAPRAISSRSERIGATVRVHLANPWAILITPALVTLGVFALNFAIWHTVLLAAGDRGVEPNAFNYNGGVTWVFVFMVVVGVQSMNQTFSFTVGLGSTRRDYFAGTAVVFIGLAVAFGLFITAMAGVERLTDGWGVGGRFFAPGNLASLPLWELATMYSLVLALLMFVGAAAGSVFVRWQATGLIVLGACVALIVVGTLYVLVATHTIDEVGAFIGGRTQLQLSALSIPVTALCALASYMLLRRATPKG